MDTRNIIAALIWAIVCAGITHGQSAVPTEGTSGTTSTQRDIITDSISLDNVTPDVLQQSTTAQVHTSEISTKQTTTGAPRTELASSTTKSTTQVPPTDSTAIVSSTIKQSRSTEAENCMVPRKENFIECFENLGNNAVQYIATRNLSGFLDDICDVNRSKPHIECIKRHFRECPEFLNRPEVQVLQFGPYHIKDIQYFSSIDQMCSCATGLVCIQELIRIKNVFQLTKDVATSPWLKMPNYDVICHNDTVRYIGCVRQNLRQCQSPLTKRYGEDFTNDDAEDVKRIYEFSKEHCDTINKEDFIEKYRCIDEKSRSDDFRECINSAQILPSARKICRMRDCVKELIEDECDADELTSLYIDAVNVYRRDDVRLLNNQCVQSSATETGISLAAFVLAIFMVVLI